MTNKVIFNARVIKKKTVGGKSRTLKKKLKHIKNPKSIVRGKVYKRLNENKVSKKIYKPLNKVRKINKYTNPNYLIKSEIRKTIRKLFPSYNTMSYYNRKKITLEFENAITKSYKQALTIKQLQRRRSYLKSKVKNAHKKASDLWFNKYKKGRFRNYNVVVKTKTRSELSKMNMRDRLKYEKTLTSEVSEIASLFLGEIGALLDAASKELYKEYENDIKYGNFNGSFDDYVHNSA